jgi:hypothetical protein
MSQEKFQEWVVMELMGHRRLAGLLSEVEIGGASFLKLDVPDADGGFCASQFYNPAAVYSMTPTTEEIAREVAKQCVCEPVHRWELRALAQPHEPYHNPDFDYSDGLDFDDEDFEEHGSIE